MFGYVYPSKMDLTFRDYFKFRAYYCGICKSIKKNYGEVSRLCINYDVTFLAVLLSSVYKSSDKPVQMRCILNPLTRKKIVVNEFVDYCASMNMLLAYFKLLDNYSDDKSVAALMGTKIIHRSFVTAKNKYPEKARKLQEYLDLMNQLEVTDNSTLNQLADIFGKLLGEIFAYNYNASESELLRTIGYNIGKYIYILDCYEDLPHDIKKKRFNPLIHSHSDEARQVVSCQLEKILQELNNLIEQLELKQSKEIIYNIVKLGLKNTAESVMNEKR